MGTFGNTNPVLIRHDFKRAVYRALLSEFSTEEVKAFFRKVPLSIDGRRLPETEMFELLWKEKAKLPSCYDAATDNELEPFLVSKGRTLGQMMKKILWLNNNSSVIPGRVLLGWFYPRLESLFTSIDSRDIAFALITIHNENWIPYLIHRRIRKIEMNGWIRSTLVFIFDQTYGEFLDWDLESIGGPQILAAPVMLGMPPFERFGMLADTRPVERVVWEAEDAPSWDGEVLRIGGVEHGRRISFHSFLNSNGLDISKYNPPDMMVAEMTRDYACPVRNRIVLHSGCVYGAPLYLHYVEHRKLKHASASLFGNLVTDMVREENLNKDELESKHRALMASLSGKSEFRYFHSDESMTLNGLHFTKGVPAKILRHILAAFVKDGKTEFEYREFKREFDISLGQKNSNFEVRFYRLITALTQKCPEVRIEKSERGRFHLKARCRVVFEEHATAD